MVCFRDRGIPLRPDLVSVVQGSFRAAGDRVATPKAHKVSLRRNFSTGYTRMEQSSSVRQLPSSLYCRSDLPRQNAPERSRHMIRIRASSGLHELRLFYPILLTAGFSSPVLPHEFVPSAQLSALLDNAAVCVISAQVGAQPSPPLKSFVPRSI